MTMTEWETLLKPCECEWYYSVRLHGDDYALFYGRCDHRHGYNLAYISEVAFNCDLTHIEKLINLGAAEYAKNPDGGHLAE